jgi:hypothetical protein
VQSRVQPHGRNHNQSHGHFQPGLRPQIFRAWPETAIPTDNEFKYCKPL